MKREKLPICIFQFVERACMALSISCTAAIMVFVSLDAILRYSINRPITGASEITEDFLMVGLVFLAISYTLKKGGHVRVTFCHKYLTPQMIRTSEFIFMAASAAFFLLLTVASWKVFMEAVRAREFSSSILYYPMAPSYFLVTLGSGCTFLRLLGSLMASLWKRDQGQGDLIHKAI